MTYKIAEKFKSVQGEGVYAGTPMAFIRFVGCSVGKRICQRCDTDFDKSYEWRGGGEFTHQQLLHWVYPYRHVCFTGGEPLNQELLPFFEDNEHVDMFHIETSGTVDMMPLLHSLYKLYGDTILKERLWVCISPKPGFSENTIRDCADEIKVIVPGLGELTERLSAELGTKTRDFRWPTIEDALRWARTYKRPVFLQPRNAKYDVDKNNLMIVQDIIRDNPELRLSVQLHKILRVQ